jgi:hypothetical protein
MIQCALRNEHNFAKFVAMCIVHLEACTLINENGFSRENFFE